MATVVDGVPLFYDGANEHGLCMAGLPLVTISVGKWDTGSLCGVNQQ